MSETKIPPQFREKAFRFFEPALAEIVKNFPEVTRLDPGTLSPVTYSCRLRDSKRALFININEWKTVVNKEMFLVVHEDIVVSQRTSGMIWAGSELKLREAALTEQDVKTTLLSPIHDGTSMPAGTVVLRLDINRTDPLHMRAVNSLCVLLSARLIKPVPVFEVELSPDEVDALEGKYDIAFVPNEGKKTYTLLSNT